MMNENEEEKRTNAFPENTVLRIIHIIIPTIIILGLVFLLYPDGITSSLHPQLSLIVSLFKGDISLKNIIIDLSVLLWIPYIMEILGFDRFNLFGLNRSHSH